jgi:hypothetical protein
MKRYLVMISKTNAGIKQRVGKFLVQALNAIDAKAQTKSAHPDWDIDDVFLISEEFAPRVNPESLFLKDKINETLRDKRASKKGAR